MKRSGAMLEHIWSIGPDSSLDDLKHSIDMLVKVMKPFLISLNTMKMIVCCYCCHCAGEQEYLLSADVVEAGKCVQELNSPHYHHEGTCRSLTCCEYRN